jgi:DNA-binding IclR family transcriptional regulator
MSRISESKEDAVPALRRAVQILDLVAATSDHLSAADITRLLSLPKSSAHGLLSVMFELGLLARAQDGSLRVGPHSLRWASSFLSQLDIVALFHDCLALRPYLEPYTVTLTVREGPDVVYIGCRNSAQPLGHSFRIGMRLPAPFTATGKMLLSELAEDELSRVLEPFPKPLTARSVVDVAALKSELETTRARGFSIDDGQIRDGMICIGAAIHNHEGKAVYGIAISLIRSEADKETIERLGLALRETAQALSQRMGGG